MPFQSEKQRRYMHANLPDIANRWEAKYGLGGVAGLNAQLNSLPEYYLPKNQGGLIPSHQAGIYGLEDGGRVGFFAAGLAQGDDISPGPSSDHGGGNGHPHGGIASTYSAPEKSTPEPDRDGRSEALINISQRPPRYKTVETHVPHTDQTVKTQIRDYYDPEGYQKRAPQDKPSITIGDMGVNLLTFALTGGIDNPLTRRAASKVVKWGADKIGLEKTINTFVGENFGSIDDMKKRIEERVAKEDLIQSLPKGHPERIQLEEIVEKKTPPQHERDNGGTQETNIKIENIEEVNDAKTQLLRKYQEMNDASRLAWLRQQEMQAKKQAYLENFRRMYMSAQGGRVPAGYNTGGLSNLFRLKNR